MSFGTISSPTVPFGWAASTNFDQCLHIVWAIGKCTDTFRWIFSLGKGLMGGGYVGICQFVMGQENFHEGGAGFLSIFTEQWKNKYEKVPSTESK